MINSLNIIELNKSIHLNWHLSEYHTPSSNIRTVIFLYEGGSGEKRRWGR